MGTADEAAHGAHHIHGLGGQEHAVVRQHGIHQRKTGRLEEVSYAAFGDLHLIQIAEKAGVHAVERQLQALPVIEDGMHLTGQVMEGEACHAAGLGGEHRRGQRAGLDAHIVEDGMAAVSETRPNPERSWMAATRRSGVSYMAFHAPAVRLDGCGDRGERQAFSRSRASRTSRQPGAALSLSGKDARRGIRPDDADIRVIPAQGTLVFRVVEIRAFVVEMRGLAQYEEAVGHARRHPELMLIVRREDGPEPLPERRGIGADVHGHVKNAAQRDGDQLALRMAALEMQATQGAPAGTRMIVLHEGEVDAGRGIALPAARSPRRSPADPPRSWAE